MPSFFYDICAFFIHTWTTVGICIFIGLLAVFLGVRFWNKLRGVRHDLEAAHAKLTQTPEDQTEFAQTWDRGEVSFEDLPRLRSAWRGFVAHVRHADMDVDGVNKGLLTTNDPREFFHHEGLIESQVNLRFYSAVPGMLTGCGILGTFFGLAGGVTLAYGKMGLDGTLADVGDLTRSLENLLGGAGQAFWSSIVGLIGSLLFQYFYKSKTHALSRSIEAVNEALDVRIEVMTMEDLAFNQMRLMSNQNQVMNQVAQSWRLEMQQLLNELFEKQDKSNEKTLEALKRLNDTLDQFRIAQVEELGNVIKEAVGKIAEAVKAGIDPATDALRQTVAELTKVLENLKEQMGATQNVAKDVAATTAKATQEVQSAAEGVAEVFRGGADTLKPLMEQLQEVGQQFNAQMTESTKQLNDALGALTQVQGEQADILQRYGEAGTLMADAVGKLDAVCTRFEHVEAVSRALGETCANFKVATEAMRAMLDQLNEGVMNMRSAVGESTTSITQCATDVRGSFEALAQSIQTGVTVVTEQAERLAEALDDAACHEAAQKELTQQILSCVKDLNTASEGVAAALTSMRSAADAIKNAAARAEAEAGGAGKVRDQLSKLNQEVFDAIAKHTAELNTMVRDTLSTLAERLSALQQAMRNNLQAADGGLASAVQTLNDELDNWQESVKANQAMRPSTKDVEQIKQLLDQMKSLLTEQAGLQDKFNQSLKSINSVK